MLESVQVDITAVERVVRGDIVGELHDLEVDALVGELILCGLPQILIDAADNAELHGRFSGLVIVAGVGLVAGCESECKGCSGENGRKNSFKFHLSFLRKISAF